MPPYKEYKFANTFQSDLARSLQPRLGHHGNGGRSSMFPPRTAPDYHYQSPMFPPRTAPDPQYQSPMFPPRTAPDPQHQSPTFPPRTAPDPQHQPWPSPPHTAPEQTHLPVPPRTAPDPNINPQRPHPTSLLTLSINHQPPHPNPQHHPSPSPPPTTPDQPHLHVPPRTAPDPTQEPDSDANLPEQWEIMSYALIGTLAKVLMPEQYVTHDVGDGDFRLKQPGEGFERRRVQRVRTLRNDEEEGVMGGG